MEKNIELIDGRMVAPSDLYMFNNNILLDSYNAAVEHADNVSADALLEKILSRFESDSCLKPGETKDEHFASQFSSFVNGQMSSPKEVAKKMGREHRYLQDEMFKVCLEYIKVLAENCEKGYYDGRNKYAVETSKIFIDHLKEINYPY